MKHVVGVVLAAGKSERAKGPKALFRLDDGTLIERAVRTMRAAGLDDVWVIVGPPHAERLRAHLSGVRFVDNPSPERGMLSSVREVALAARAAGDVTGVVLSLIDHPRVSPVTIRALLDNLSGADVVRPRCRGQRGHPVYLSASALKAVRRAELDQRLSDVLRELPVLRDVEVEDEGVLDDFDTAIELLLSGAVPPEAP
ncbi:MAG: nucleotidyltransferase family protein [Polyangiaceae bacterium]